MHDSSKKRVLVVDDDATLLELLVDTLEAVGYETVAAPGGVEALEALSRQSFDIIVTDVKMPGIDGISLLRRVRRHYPDLPVLFITGVASPDIIASAGPDGFLSKPFRISKIEEMIEATLQRHGESRSHAFRRVLVVDEDSEFREMLADALTVGQFIPFVVPSAHDALRELDNGEFDAVITDLGIPDLDWPSFHEKIKTERPDLPIILTGSEQNEQTVEHSIADSEADAFLKKPFPAAEVITVLNKLTLVSNEQ
ncbi:response regulator [candidate division GN15 bacterium]|nr:response regulator [candidate division GN15 bacterium]